MKVVVPMAGRGSRFSSRGVDVPKPLIPVGGQSMVFWALRSLADLPYSKIIFVVLAEHEASHGITESLRDAFGDRTEVVLLDDVTEGQLCTVLAARDWIDDEEDVLVGSCDTLVTSDLADVIANRPADCHGIISVADMPGEQWSFARVDETGAVVEVAEKVRISDHASTGLYYFSSGRELVATADEMIRNGERTRGEYYVIPVYQKYIDRGWRVDISVAKEMWDMGTPETLEVFQRNYLQQRGVTQGAS